MESLRAVKVIFLAQIYVLALGPLLNEFYFYKK